MLLLVSPLPVASQRPLEPTVSALIRAVCPRRIIGDARESLASRSQIRAVRSKLPVINHRLSGLKATARM